MNVGLPGQSLFKDLPSWIMLFTIRSCFSDGPIPMQSSPKNALALPDIEIYLGSNPVLAACRYMTVHRMIPRAYSSYNCAEA